MSGRARNFQIKLLSGKNVIFVDCEGYEREFFVPQIVNGRISLQNVMPNRRCCNASVDNLKTHDLASPSPIVLNIKATGVAAGTPQRHPFDQLCNLSSPMARSTPTSNTGSGSGKENSPQLQSPYLARHRTTVNLPSPAHHEVQAPLIETTLRSPLPATDCPTFNISKERPRPSPCHLSPCPSGMSSESGFSNFSRKTQGARTYSRKTPTVDPETVSIASWSPVSKKKKTAKVSSTKALSPTMKLDVRRRKLIVDNKKTLTKEELQRDPTKNISKTNILRKQVTGKTRLTFNALKQTAFDRLTQPGLHNLSEILRNQFRDACVERYSDPLPNYKALAKTKELETDRQVKALLNREKRLEKQLPKPRVPRENDPWFEWNVTTT